MVTIDARDSLIAANIFTGETADLAPAIRARVPNTDILNTTFDTSTGGDTRGVFEVNDDLDSGDGMGCTTPHDPNEVTVTGFATGGSFTGTIIGPDGTRTASAMPLPPSGSRPDL